MAVGCSVGVVTEIGEDVSAIGSAGIGVVPSVEVGIGCPVLSGEVTGCGAGGKGEEDDAGVVASVGSVVVGVIGSEEDVGEVAGVVISVANPGVGGIGLEVEEMVDEADDMGSVGGVVVARGDVVRLGTVGIVGLVVIGEEDVGSVGGGVVIGFGITGVGGCAALRSVEGVFRSDALKFIILLYASCSLGSSGVPNGPLAGGVGVDAADDFGSIYLS